MGNKRVYEKAAQLLNTHGVGWWEDPHFRIATADDVRGEIKYLIKTLQRFPKSEYADRRGLWLLRDGDTAYYDVLIHVGTVAKEKKENA